MQSLKNRPHDHDFFLIERFDFSGRSLTVLGSSNHLENVHLEVALNLLAASLNQCVNQSRICANFPSGSNGLVVTGIHGNSPTRSIHVQESAMFGRILNRRIRKIVGKSCQTIVQTLQRLGSGQCFCTRPSPVDRTSGNQPTRTKRRKLIKAGLFECRIILSAFFPVDGGKRLVEFVRLHNVAINARHNCVNDVPALKRIVSQAFANVIADSIYSEALHHLLDRH